MWGQPVSYEVGDVIDYAVGGGTRRVRVENKEADVKNGRPGFDGTMLGKSADCWDGMEPGSGCWGYDEQIVRVVERAAIRVPSTRAVAALPAGGQCSGSGELPQTLPRRDGFVGTITRCSGCHYPVTPRRDGRVRAHKRPADSLPPAATR